MGNLILFILLNVLVFLFLWLTVKNYRTLSLLLVDKESIAENRDAMSVAFLEKIFHARTDVPAVRKQQKKVIRMGAITAVLLLLSRYLFHFL